MAILIGVFPTIAVWLVLLMTTVFCFVLSAYLWVLWVQSRQVLNQPEYLVGETELEASRSWLGFAIVSSLGGPCLIFLIWTKRRTIGVVIQLYREISRVLAAMPFLLLQPFLSGVFVAAAVSAWFYMYLWIESSGREKRPRPDFFVYEKDALMVVTRWCNIFVSLWMVSFVSDCQRVVVAGAASYWYFCRSRNRLGIPVFYGFYYLVRYHLGSVSLGSLYSLTLYIPKQVLRLIEKYEQQRGKIGFCFKFSWWTRCREYILHYYTRNAYVEIFLLGCTYRQAGQRIFQTFTENPRAAVKDVGNFVVACMKLLVSLVALLAAAVVFQVQEEESVLHLWILLALQGLIAYLIADCFCSLYQAVSDAMFVCYCEDCKNFDAGGSKPYFTTGEFFEFVENCSDLLGIHNHGEGETRAWNLAESSISSAVTIGN